MIVGLVGKRLIPRRFPLHKKFVVRLSAEARGVCQEIIKPLKGSSQKFRRAQRLLNTDADRPAWSAVRTAAAFHGRGQPSEHLRKRLVTEGFAWALEGKQRQEPPTPCQLDGEAEAPWMARRLGQPPSGYGPWPLHLLADAMGRWALVAAISDETVRQG
jgi:hypothetical protein